MCPSLAQVSSSTGPIPDQGTPGAQPEEPAAPVPPPTGAAPASPSSPFGAAPGVFPGISARASNPSAAETASPFGAAPGVFPGLGPPAPAAATEQPTGAPAAAPGIPAAETPTSEQPTAPTGPPGQVPGAAAAALIIPPAFLTPQYGFGTLAPPPTVGNVAPAAPPEPPTTGGLPPIKPGAQPVQTGDLRAPPVLIVPSAAFTAGYTDNPHNRPQTFSDVYGDLKAGGVVSVDSSRFQGQFSGSGEYRKYARASDLDTLNANLLGFGLGTIVRDHVYVDARAAMTQLSQTGGFAFATSNLIPPSQQVQTTTLSLTPVVRESFNGWVDAELRYNLGLDMFNNGSLLNNNKTATSNAAIPTTLSDTIQHDATLTFATGRRFTVIGSRLTLEAVNVDTKSSAKSTQLRATDDLEYQFNPEIAALARIGYENIDYPLQPTASTTGPIWLIGGRWTPLPGSYLIAHYGRQQGFYGFDGTLRYQLTPSTSFSASLTRNLASPQQQILTDLNTSQVDANGNLVSQYTGLPTALANPDFSFAVNNIYRHQDARVGLQSLVGRNTFGIFVFADRRSLVGSSTATTAIAQTLSGTDTAMGANFSWGRSLTPRLNGTASLGYAREIAAHQKTLTANLSLAYTLSDKLSAVLSCQFINVESAIASSATVSGSYTRNQVELGLTRSF